MKINNNAKRVVRKYFSQTFEITTWEKLEIEFEKLLTYQINSADELIEFWKRVGELDKIIEDKMAYLYIDMTRFADQSKYKDAFNNFMERIEAKRQPYAFKLKQKFYDNQFRIKLPQEYDHLNKIIANEIELFREENIPLFVKEQELSARYGEITSKMTVVFQGEEKTIQQLAPYFEHQVRNVREEAWRLMYGRYAQDQIILNTLFDELKNLRVQIAKNAGFTNYRDYAHKSKGRFSYTPEDLLRLHEVVEKLIVPLVEEFSEERKVKLGLDTLKPWDLNVDIDGELPKPFATHDELITKGIQTISHIDPAFGVEIENMQTNEFIDAESRKGKAPGDIVIRSMRQVPRLFLCMLWECDAM